MSQISVKFSGSVVAEPERRDANGTPLMEFPVYVNHARKNKETGKYDPTGEVSKIRVTLWREKADMTDVRKGDIVEVTGTMIERAFNRKDGTEGRQLQTDYIESCVVKYRKDGQVSSTPVASAPQGGNAWDDSWKVAAAVADEPAPF
jgi:single-stranded DNA-binding protein